MCMGCAEKMIMTGDGKLPDTTDAALYIGLFALWIILLTHVKKGKPFSFMSAWTGKINQVKTG